jgi:hypothetical protein
MESRTHQRSEEAISPADISIFINFAERALLANKFDLLLLSSKGFQGMEASEITLWSDNITIYLGND